MKSAFKHIAGLFVLGALILMATPAPRAQALSLATPGIASTNASSAAGAVTEVHWRRYPHAHRYYYHRHYHPYWRRHHYYHPYRYGYRHHYYHHRRYY